MSSHCLLQGIFLIQGSSPHFLLGRRILYHCTKSSKNLYDIANGWKVPWLSHHIALEDCPRSSDQRFPISPTCNLGFDVRVLKRCWDFPGSPVFKIGLPMYSLCVWSLVGELRSNMPWGQKAKNKTSSIGSKSIKTLKMIHVKKKS